MPQVFINDQRLGGVAGREVGTGGRLEPGPGALRFVFGRGAIDLPSSAVEALEAYDQARGRVTVVPARRPDVDEGRNISYAIQWILFAIIAIGGWFFFLRREARDERVGVELGEARCVGRVALARDDRRGHGVCLRWCWARAISPGA